MVAISEGPPKTADRVSFAPSTIAKLGQFAEKQGIPPEMASAHVAQMYEGTSAKYVAKLTGLDQATVKRVIISQGIVPRTPAESQALLKQQGKSLWGISEKQRSAISSATGTKLQLEGKGIFNPEKADEYRRNRKRANVPVKIPKTKDEVRADAQRAGWASRDSGKGALAVSSQKRKEWIRKGAMASSEVSPKKIEHNGLYFDSSLEAAAGAMLEKFIPGFALQKGENFQVIFGDNVIKVDFVVQGVAVEYAPVIPFVLKAAPAFKTFEELERYRAYRDTFTGSDKKDYVRQIKATLKERYTNERREKLTEADGANRELVVVSSPHELYAEVIARFGSNVPESARDFNRLFNATNREISKNLPAGRQGKKEQK